MKGDEVLDIQMIKAVFDACYQAKRIRDMLPALPKGVTPSYIHFLDAMETLEKQGKQVKVSDISDMLGIPRPGVTRTVKEMEKKGYVSKQTSAEDGRITYLFISEKGKELSQKYNAGYFSRLAPFLQDISDEEAKCTIQTIKKFYQVMAEGRVTIE